MPGRDTEHQRVLRALLVDSIEVVINTLLRVYLGEISRAFRVSTLERRRRLRPSEDELTESPEGSDTEQEGGDEEEENELPKEKVSKHLVKESQAATSSTSAPQPVPPAYIALPILPSYDEVDRQKENGGACFQDCSAKARFDGKHKTNGEVYGKRA